MYTYTLIVAQEDTNRMVSLVFINIDKPYNINRIDSMKLSLNIINAVSAILEYLSIQSLSLQIKA